jgi:hypothetical protein
MSNVAIVQRRLLDLGYNPVQVAGILGNLQQESGRNLDPNVVGDKGTAFGIAQWRGPRFEGLQSFAQQRGVDWRDPALQAEYIHHELNTTERRAGDLLRNAKTPEESARAFIGFERPAGFTWNDPTAGHGWDNRLKNAYSILGQPIPEGGSSSVQTAKAAPSENMKIGGYDVPRSGIASLLDGLDQMGASQQQQQPMAAPVLAANDATPLSLNLVPDQYRRRISGLL